MDRVGIYLRKSTRLLYKNNFLKYSQFILISTPNSGTILSTCFPRYENILKFFIKQYIM